MRVVSRTNKNSKSIVKGIYGTVSFDNGECKGAPR